MKQNIGMTESLSPLGKLRPASPRIAPLVDLTDELHVIMGGGINSPAGTPLNIFGTIAHHPKLLKRFMNFAGLFLNKGLLPAREREIVILRVGWNCQSVYEFGQHTIIGQRVGLSLSEIEALTKNSNAYKWSKRDSALIAMSDELCADNCVSEATWRNPIIRGHIWIYIKCKAVHCYALCNTNSDSCDLTVTLLISNPHTRATIDALCF